jgi:hypothetical protein
LIALGAQIFAGRSEAASSKISLVLS